MVRVYALEAIVAEKLRAILQHIEKLEERGWSRSRARHYYDLWRVLGAYRNQMNLTDFPTSCGQSAPCGTSRSRAPGEDVGRGPGEIESAYRNRGIQNLG